MESKTESDPESICVICLDRTNPSSKPTKVLRCGHIFHSDCILPWIERTNSCPSCRSADDPDRPATGVPYENSDLLRDFLADLPDGVRSFSERLIPMRFLRHIRDPQLSDFNKYELASCPCCDVKHKLRRCTYCNKLTDIRDLKKCSACHTARYCNDVCQRRDWNLQFGGHRQECPKLLDKYLAHCQGSAVF